MCWKRDPKVSPKLLGSSEVVASPEPIGSSEPMASFNQLGSPEPEHMCSPGSVKQDVGPDARCV